MVHLPIHHPMNTHFYSIYIDNICNCLFSVPISEYKKSLLSRLFLRLAVLITHRLYTGQGRDTSDRDGSCKGRIIKGTWPPVDNGHIVKGTQCLCFGDTSVGNNSSRHRIYAVRSDGLFIHCSKVVQCPPFISKFSLREWRLKSFYYFCKLLSIEVLNFYHTSFIS